MSVRTGLPVVRVPVLSTAMTWSRPVCSSAAPFLMSTPSCAPRPVPTMMDMGVARPMAQGQAMTSTATKTVSGVPAGSSLPNHQARAASRARSMTDGTK